MVIKQVNRNTFDIFVGIGWENWTRLKVDNKRLLLKAGKPLDKQVYKKLYEVLL